MISEYNVKSEIRTHYGSVYEGKAEKVMPWRTKLSRGLFKSGVFSMIGGAIGMAVAGVMACFSAPFTLPVLAGSTALFLVGTPCFPASKKLYRRIESTGRELMETDIENLKLVKSYVTDVLPGKTRALEIERKSEVQAHDDKLKKMDGQQVDLQENRKAALLIIRQGMDQLEQKIAASQKELSFFQKEAEETLGDDFAATARKQQPPSGAGAVTVNPPGPGPAPRRNSN